MIDALQLYENLKDSDVLLSYKGEVSFDLVNSFLEIVEQRLDRVENDPKLKKKMFNILVECLQNLCHHVEISEKDVKHLPKGRNTIITVWDNGDQYIVTTGNYIANDDIPKLEAWIKRINNLSKVGLRDLYKEVLDNNTFSAKGGGGLGFIDIARKSGEKLGYNFQHMDEGYSFFSFRIEIPKV
jgi:hypothetical protein